jgi:lipoate-protein ligase B
MGAVLAASLRNMFKGEHLIVEDWGLIPYGEALRRQEVLVEERIAGLWPDRLILLEHHPVVTIGKSGESGDLLLDESSLRQMGVGVGKSDRGGQATYHGPGQLVVYPILKLHAEDLYEYVRRLLDVIAEGLIAHGLLPSLKRDQPGLWVGNGKVASVGIACRKRVTYHGVALNVNTDLDPFDYIVPCGHPGQRITSMARELRAKVDMSTVKSFLVDVFFKKFGYASDQKCIRTAHLPAIASRSEDMVAGIQSLDGHSL